MGRLTVRVQPGAARDELRLEGGQLRVWLTAPPIDGRANKRLVELLAKRLRVPKGSVRVLHGAASRDKIVEIASVEADEIAHRLEAGF
jgi:uncharacterized protein (TIGR00251 family)